MGKKNLDEAVDQGRRAFLRQSLLGGVATGVLVGCGQADIPALDEISDEAVPEAPEDDTIPEEKPIQGRAIQVSSRMTR